MAKKSITTTKNYNLFNVEKGNREVDVARHAKLKASMKEYGFLWCFPIVCVRDKAGKLIVKDGQHRLEIAKELGIEVSYVVTEVNFDTATINCSSISWSALDYARKWSAKGKSDYTTGITFSEQYGLPVGRTFQILSGVSHAVGRSRRLDFQQGRFTIQNLDVAHAIASTYTAMIAIASTLKTARFLEALSSVCPLPEFEPARLIQKAKNQQDKLLSYSTREAYIDMIEKVYNYRSQNLVPLAILARRNMQSKEGE